MMYREPVQRWHLHLFEPQDSQEEDFLGSDMEMLLMDARGFTLIDNSSGEPEPFAIFLLIDQDGTGRVMAITAFSRDLGARRLLFAARQARDWLANWGKFRRVEAYCAANAVDEIHWCRYILGMEPEGVLKSFFPTGEDAVILGYVRKS